MQLRTGQIANLVLVTLSTFFLQYRTEAQYQHYGTSRYPRVVSAVEDSSGKFLLLNLQSKSFLQAPSIQYHPGSDGRTVMIADFPGLLWTAEPRVLKPANLDIESVRLGQVQENPPIFRISITTSNPDNLRRLEFRCQSKALLIKYPTKSKRADGAAEDAEIASAARISEGAAAGRKKSDGLGSALALAGTKSAYSASHSQSDSTGTGSTTVSNPTASERSASRNSSAQALPPLAPKRALNTSKPPFRSGGLFLELGPDPALAAAGSLRENSTEGATSDAKLLPPRAPDLASAASSKQTDDKMPKEAPAIGKAKMEGAGDDNDAVKKQSLGLAGKLHRLFHKHNDNDLPSAEAAAAAGAAGESAADTTGGGAGAAKIDAAPIALNPQLEFAGKDPLKVKFKFDAALKYKSFRMDDPPRYVVDVEGADAHYNPSTEPDKNPYLKSVRIGSPSDKLTRIVLDLAQASVAIKEELDASGRFLILSLGGAESALEKAPGRGREVVLDAGHGGSDPGAQRGDINEKDITLAITQKLKRYLENRGVRVIMTRSDDTFVSLEDRTKITNEYRPDAFVSIHINSLDTDRDIKGIETYYQTDQSRTLADKVHEQLVEKLQVPDRSVRKARFYVVRHTERPAILAEVGYISNKEERDKLISSDYQAKIAESVGQGVILYLGNAAEPTKTVVSNSATKEGVKASLSQRSKSNF